MGADWPHIPPPALKCLVLECTDDRVDESPAFCAKHRATPEEIADLRARAELLDRLVQAMEGGDLDAAARALRDADALGILSRDSG